jgi:hypothetical protein
VLAGALLLALDGACQAPWDDMLCYTPPQATMAIWADLRQAQASALLRRVEADARWRTLADCDLDADQLLLALDEQGPTAWVLRGGAAARLSRCGALRVLRARPDTVVLAPERTAPRVAGLVRRPRARRSDLDRLLCGERPRTVAFAATLGREARRRLGDMPALRDAGTLRSVSGSADLRNGLRLAIRARLGSRRAAARVAQGIAQELSGWRRQPLLALAGLGPLVDGVRVEAEGSAARIEASADEAVFERLLDQLDLLSSQARKP